MFNWDSQSARMDSSAYFFLSLLSHDGKTPDLELQITKITLPFASKCNFNIILPVHAQICN